MINLNGRIVSAEQDLSVNITGDITGDIGVIISGNTGPVHLGAGNVYTGVTVIENDAHTDRRG
ncbi:hypothetical protein GT755_09840 [Herbidospora sp. NEAU-GS84]|uniref:Uncharacterized protein n=1 Tax=Herbidospora solisilvae TaxID=2696284 RepID=A0A7C9JB09_9ACTN|nr:hypothetical protein [Herbidospora solisilvae]NAS21984.1 hypothetical protein [Herbidospora solisilvae]